MDSMETSRSERFAVPLLPAVFTNLKAAGTQARETERLRGVYHHKLKNSLRFIRKMNGSAFADRFRNSRPIASQDQHNKYVIWTFLSTRALQ
jgi:hypothetical protein